MKDAMKRRIGICLTLVLALSLGVGTSQARYLNPATGRFQTMDSYEGNSSDPLSLHKYLYANGDPVNGIDPSGNMTYAQLGTAMLGGALIGGMVSCAVDLAYRRATTATSIFQGAALGAFLGPFAVEYPLFGGALGFYGAYESVHSFVPILRDPNATLSQKVAASALIVSAVYGTKAGFDYANRVKPIKLLDGSGPEAGILEVSVFRKSTKAFEAYRPSGDGAIEFIFDPTTQRFLVGRPKTGTGSDSPHEYLVKLIGADESKVVGGKFKRGPSGEMITNEGSGHFHQNWTPEIRANFVLFLESMTGGKVTHTETFSW